MVNHESLTTSNLIYKCIFPTNFLKYTVQYVTGVTGTTGPVDLLFVTRLPRDLLFHGTSDVPNITTSDQ